MANKDKKVMVIGLDCATPRTLFEEFIDVCPNIKKLMNKGVYGPLKSSDPPITIPAWMVMETGKRAGTLGLYGFRHKKEGSYNDFWIATSNKIREPTIWDIIAKENMKSCILGIPPTYPVKPMNGCLISGFITPGTSSNFTHPPKLKEEIKEHVGDYILDATFRTEKKKELLENIYEMTDVHFKTVKYIIQNKEWNFCHFVIIGLDRMHHAFWKYFDSSHSKYKPGNKYEKEMEKYYKYLDDQVGELLELLDENTTIMIVSDHGAKAMKGCICVNMALEELGLLKFKETPKTGSRLEDTEIDWSKTKAWGWGGYYARIFLNVEGREEFGIIKPKKYEKTRDKIIKKLKSIKDDKGNPMDTKVYKPEELFPILRGDPPDLMVYFDDLNWRSAGTVGYKSMYLQENDTGPDDAVHDYFGVYVIYDPKKNIGENRGERNILDIAPTCLEYLGVEIPSDLEGKKIELYTKRDY